MKSIPLKLLSLAILAGLLINPSLSFKGASDGLLLWFNVVFPTLFPFLAATNLVTALQAVPLLMKPLRCLLGPLLKLNSTGCYTFLTGLLCGYPIGAANAAGFVSSGEFTKKEGAYLLSISNYPSLMFLIGYALPLMSPGIRFFHVFLSVCLPAFPLAFLSRKFYGISSMKEFADNLPINREPWSFDSLLMSCLEIMEKICGYIMLFSILAAFWNHYIPNAFPLKIFILSLMEMTVGIREASQGMTGLLRDTVIVAAAAFGGFSGAAQTQTVIKNAGLSIRHYIVWKWLHLVLSSLVFILLSSLLPPVQ